MRAPQDADALAIGGGGVIIVNPIPIPPLQIISITSLTMPNNTLPIGGVNGRYTATIENIFGTQTGGVLQGYIIQGTARRAAGGVVLSCGAGSGVLPNGDCTMSFVVGASNTASGTGTLRAGVATFELDLTLASGIRVTRSMGVNLIPGVFSASGSTVLSLSGALGHESMSASNDGYEPVSGLSYQATVVQGSARREAGATPVYCPGQNWGTLPGYTSCGNSIYGGVKNTNVGTGTLVAGPATLVVDFQQGGTALASKSWAITLLDGRFTNITANAHPSIVGGGPQNATVSFVNNGPALTAAALNAYVRQGSVVRTATNATAAACGTTAGIVPTGACSTTIPFLSPSNVDTYGGQLGGGAAVLGVRFYGSGGLVDSTEVPITLVAPPAFTSVTPAGAAKIGLPGPLVNYTATLQFAGEPILNAAVKAHIIQGAATREATTTAGVAVNCGAGYGTVPTGSCTFVAQFFATNTGVGTGQFVAGAATLQLQLFDPINGVLTTQLVPITLVQ
jgi:hypothetical protein